MRNFLALVGAAVVTFAGAGWYLGWYKVSSLPAPNGRQSLQVDINGKKIDEDIESLKNRVGGDGKPAPLTTPQGPASSFFGPEPKPQGDGWKPIGSAPKVDPDDGGFFGFAKPRN